MSFFLGTAPRNPTAAAVSERGPSRAISVLKQGTQEWINCLLTVTYVPINI